MEGGKEEMRRKEGCWFKEMIKGKEGRDVRKEVRRGMEGGKEENRRKEGCWFREMIKMSILFKSLSPD